MPAIIQGINKDILDTYDGYDEQEVGLGLSNPNIYQSPQYQKKKVSTIALGSITSCVYSGFDHDPNPDILSISYVAPYSCIMGLNLRYGNPAIRSKILKYILTSNKQRIAAKQPIMIDWHSLKKVQPEIDGMTRLYKVLGLQPRSMYHLNEWVDVARAKTPWDNHYRKIIQRKSK